MIMVMIMVMKCVFVYLSQKIITSSLESLVTTVTTRNHAVQLQVSFHGFSQLPIGFSWFQVGFYGFSRFQAGFSWHRWVFMVIYGSMSLF